MQNNDNEKFFDIILADLGQNKFEVIKLLVEKCGIDANEAIQVESKLPLKLKECVSNNESLVLNNNILNICFNNNFIFLDNSLPHLFECTTNA